MQPMGRLYDWRDVNSRPDERYARVNPWRVLSGLMALVCLATGGVYLRLVCLELRDGRDYRELAARPIERARPVPGLRGRILARDGAVLAIDERVAALAIHYRWLESPPNPLWLRRTARSRLSARDRRDKLQLDQAENQVLRDRDELHVRMSELCRLTPTDWQSRCAVVQLRITKLKEHVNRVRLERWQAAQLPRRFPSASVTNPAYIASLIARLVTPQEAYGPPEPVTIAEELDFHVIREPVDLTVVAEIEGNLDRYPGARIVELPRRNYPQGSLAAHVIGYLGNRSAVDPGRTDDLASDLVGRSGVERQYEGELHGKPGVEIERSDRGGRRLSSYQRVEPKVGRDVVLTVDTALQRSAEELLTAALERRPTHDSGGGTVLVLHAESGAILAAASAPSFEPADFTRADSGRLDQLFNDTNHPLLNRAIQMQIPPGSVFKVLTALALLDHGLDPAEHLHCQGFLHDPEHERCAIYTRTGQGHGDVTIRTAMAQSCNVFFFQHGGALGASSLIDWAARLGFGSRTGVDLPGEASGQIPSSTGLVRSGWQRGDTRSLSIGQGALLVTPLQVARLLAVVANGGRLVTPHVFAGYGLPSDLPGDDTSPSRGGDDELMFASSQPLDRISPATMTIVRDSLRDVVATTWGTANSTLSGTAVPIAGKTGSAQTSGGRADHAWFAGYAPANAPKVVFVVALEHAGDGATAAGPVVRRLVDRMHQLGYFAARS